MKITLKQANILHNIVKHPATAISYVLQVLPLLYIIWHKYSSSFPMNGDSS